MLTSRKWEKLGLLPYSQKVVNLHLPSSQVNKALTDLQIRCKSSSKTIQIEALKCWNSWIKENDIKEWKIHNFCQFAMEPLLTKKLHPLHKDSDVCKLKLNIMWNLMHKVNSEMTLEGLNYILELFLQSCFTWLASIDSLDNEIIVYILELILHLFSKEDKTIMKHTDNSFQPLTIDSGILNKLSLTFINKFLDVFDCWTKVNNKKLILKLWECFLDYCEISYEDIIKPFWHRIFKILIFEFCSEKNENVKDKLLYLHASAMRLNAVLLLSQYIRGETCFMTPCEAMLKKMMEICKISCEQESFNMDEFIICEDICKVLTLKTLSVCDYDLCNYLLDSLEDFSLKSFYWGSWCGLVECYKNTLSQVDFKNYSKKEMKFYRKLRATSVNFELDKSYLNEACQKKIESGIKILNIKFFCFDKVSNSSLELTQKNSYESLSVNINNYSHVLDFANLSNNIIKISNAINSNNSLEIVKPKGNFGVLTMPKRCLLPAIMKHCLDYNGFNKVIVTINNNLMRFTFQCIKFDKFFYLATIQNFIQHKKASEKNNSNSLLPVTYSNSTDELSKLTKKKVRTTSDKTKKTINSKVMKNAKCNVEITEIYDNLKTRSQKKNKKLENLKMSETNPTRKRRKSFEVIVQEIVYKNKLRKTERINGKETVTLSDKRELRSSKKLPGKNDKNEKPKEKKKKNDVNNKNTLNKLKNKNLIKNNKKNVKSLKNQNSIDGKLENFFKIIDTNKEEVKKLQEKIIFNKNNQKSCSKKIKGETTWKQTSLKTMIKNVNNEKERNKEIKKQKILKKKKKKQKPKCKNLTSLNETELPSSPVKALHHHNYAKILEPCCKLLQTSNFTDCFKIFPKKINSDYIKRINNVEINSISENTISKSDEIISDPNPNDFSKTENDILQQLSQVIDETDKENIRVHDNVENVFKDEVDVLNEGTFTKFSSNMETSKENNFQPDENLTKKRKFQNDDNDIDNECQNKKLKLNDCSMKTVDESSLKENVTDTKQNCIETKSLKELSPNGEKKCKNTFSNRRNSSRAFRMISLIPNSKNNIDEPGSQQDLNVLESSFKKDVKPQLKKNIHLDKNSRVSKMLANLNSNLPVDNSHSSNDDEIICEDAILTEPLLSSSISNSLPSKIVSPKNVNKKRKFISFDESKNKTIVYHIDTPPSEILLYKEKLKEQCFA